MQWMVILRNGVVERRVGALSGNQRGRNPWERVARLVLMVCLRSSNPKLTLILSSETFWVDLVIRNPLDTEVTLSALTLVVCDPKSGEPIPDVVEVEVVDDVSLNSRESRTVSPWIQLPHTPHIQFSLQPPCRYHSRSRLLGQCRSP